MDIATLYLAGVAKAGSHDDGFVVKLFVVVVDFGDADDARILARLVALFVRIRHVPVQNSLGRENVSEQIRWNQGRGVD